jgi:flagellar protein FliO/FliZ
MHLPIYLTTNWPSQLDSAGQFFSIFLMVAIVAVMAYLSFRLLSSSRGGRRGLSRNLQIIESIGVGIQTSLQIVRCGEKYLLIGVTKERVTMLAEIPKEQLTLTEGKNLLADGAFDKVLKRFIKKDTDKDE